MKSILVIENPKKILRDIRNRRRKMEAERRKSERSLRRIQKELYRMYPSEFLLEALDMLTDDDYVWQGDFDTLRKPLADMLIKANTIGILPNEVDRITRILLTAQTNR